MSDAAGTAEDTRSTADGLPSGSVTLFFSDIEGSTRAWEQHPVAMPGALAQHTGSVRGAIERHGGQLVKDTGDGVFAVFGGAAEAVAAAVDAQRALRDAAWGETGPLRARIGLHTAEMEPERGDYHGPPVNRCARIMGVGHGDQVLVSESTHRALDRVPDGVDFLDLGPTRLRDLSVAVRLFQVLHPDLPAEFPPLRSIDVLPTNLPASLSSLIGRDDALAELAGLLGETRLLTLTGPGGVGKTRLALQLAADQAERFADGVWLTELAGLSEPALVPRQIATALRIADQPGRADLDAVAWYLRGRQVLLVLDNCEHLLEVTASVVQVLLERCPRLGVVTTTREVLGVPGEVTWPAPPLAVGGADAGGTAERLFVERAREIDPRFAPTPADRAAIARVCRRLDGLPLAIELAAARTRVLSPAEIAARLDDRFRLLTGGRRTALPRQRTLEATVAWSYDLLDDRERALFDRASVFAGGFTLPAAERVCTGEPLTPEDTLDVLSALAEQSLVQHETSEEGSRFSLLETMRAYGQQQLAAAGEVGRRRGAHLIWANDFARTAEPHLDGPEQGRWLDLVAADIDNIRAALVWAASDGDPVTGLGCAATLYRYWYVRAIREGRLWLERLLTAGEQAPPKLVAKALYAAGELTQMTGDYPAARERHQAALDIYRAIGNRRGEAWTLMGLGRAEWGAVEPAALKLRFVAAVEIFRELGDVAGLAFTLPYVAGCEFMSGSPASAAEVVQEYAAIAMPTGIPQIVAHCCELSAIADLLTTDDRARPRGQLSEALRLFRQIGSTYCTLHCLENIAAWAAGPQPAAAARLLAAVEQLRLDGGTPVPPAERLVYDDASAAVLAALGPEGVAEQSRLGAALDLDAAVRLAHELLGTA